MLHPGNGCATSLVKNNFWVCIKSPPPLLLNKMVKAHLPLRRTYLGKGGVIGLGIGGFHPPAHPSCK